MSRCLIDVRQRANVFGKSVFHPLPQLLSSELCSIKRYLAAVIAACRFKLAVRGHGFQAEPPERYLRSGARTGIPRIRPRRNSFPYLHAYGRRKVHIRRLLCNRITEKPYNWVEAWQSNHQYRHKVQHFMSRCISVYPYLK